MFQKMGLSNSVSTSLRSGNRKTETYYVAPLLDNNSCPIALQPHSILEQIFSNLDLQDLANLSVTCKLFNDTVGEFLRHECCSSKLLDILNKFVNQNSGLLTQFEKFETDSMLSEMWWCTDSIQERVKGNSCLSRKGMYKMLTKIERYKKALTRVSAADERVGFPHRGNNNYVITEMDDILGREVVRVKSVCWLQVNYTWEDVKPGVYKVAMMIKIGRRFTWPHRSSDMTEWRVTYPGFGVDGIGGVGGECEKLVMVNRDWWNCLDKLQTPTKKVGQGLSVEWVELGDHGFDKNSWIRVEMPEILVVEEGNVSFELKDVQCPWWKSDILIDIIELRNL